MKDTIKTTKDISDWLPVIEREDLPIEDAIKIACKRDHSLIWEILSIRIATLNFKDAIEMANKANNWIVWCEIVMKEDLPLTNAIEICEKVNDLDVWNALPHRNDFKALSIKDVIEIAKRVDIYLIWQTLLNKDGRFNNLGKSKLLELIKNVEDLPLGDAIQIAKNVDSVQVWGTLSEREDFKSKLK